MSRMRLWFMAVAILLLGALVVGVRAAPRNPVPPAPAAVQVDKVVVEKGARTLILYRDGAEIRRYDIALGFAPIGDKEREGDGRTPEGNYLIDYRNPKSSFHLSLHISYPDATDRAEAKAQGVDPGGEIFIHGQPRGAGLLGKIRRDWTAGCIAVSNAEIREIWALVPNGTPIEIKP